MQAPFTGRAVIITGAGKGGVFWREWLGFFLLEDQPVSPLAATNSVQSSYTNSVMGVSK